MSKTEEFRDWELWWGVQAVVAPVPHKTQAAIAQDGECQQVFVEIARFATRVSREMVIDLDL